MQEPASIGRAEMEILRYITDHHPVTVRQVAEHVAATKGHVRTTVLNVMERLREKGFLARKKSAGIYQYAPRATKAELLRTFVRDFVERTLGGSVSPFMAYLVEEAELSEAEVKELKSFVHQLAADRGDRPA
jgi:predicted transcriptional regulator